MVLKDDATDNLDAASTASSSGTLRVAEPGMFVVSLIKRHGWQLGLESNLGEDPISGGLIILHDAAPDTIIDAWNAQPENATAQLRGNTEIKEVNGKTDAIAMKAALYAHQSLCMWCRNTKRSDTNTGELMVELEFGLRKRLQERRQKAMDQLELGLLADGSAEPLAGYTAAGDTTLGDSRGGLRSAPRPLPGGPGGEEDSACGLQSSLPSIWIPGCSQTGRVADCAPVDRLRGCLSSPFCDGPWQSTPSRAGRGSK